MELKFGTHIRQRYTHIGESSAVWITDLYEVLEFKLLRLTRYLSVTFIFCHCQHFLRLSIIFPVNFHPTPLSSYLSEMNPSVAVIDSLASFPFITSENVSGLKAEFPLYAAAAEDIDPSYDPLLLERHESDLPNWSRAARQVLLVQPSSAASECVFSLLKTPSETEFSPSRLYESLLNLLTP